MASSILMSNSKQNSNCVPASFDAGFLSTITNSKPNPTSNSNCTLVIENQALKVTNLTPDAVPLRTNVKPLAVAAGSPPPLHVVIPPSKPMILVKEVSLPSPSSFNSSASSELSRKEAAKNHQVRVCGWKECKAVARSLAEAFKDDELSFYWLRTDDATRRSEADIWKLHVKVCEYVVAAHCMHGLVLSIGENHEGVALWMPPGRDYDDVWSIFRSGMWRLYYQLTKEGRRRYFTETLGLAAVTKYLPLDRLPLNLLWHLSPFLCPTLSVSCWTGI